MKLPLLFFLKYVGKIVVNESLVVISTKLGMLLE